MEKELYKTYYFDPADYDERGRRKSDGKSFRDVIKEFEFDFHDTYSTEYALPFLTYGMDLTQGKSFDAVQDPFVNHEMEKYSPSVYVYGIDSAFMTEFDEYGYPILDENSDICLMETKEQERKWHLVRNDNGEWISDENVVFLTKQEARHLEIIARLSGKSLSIQHGCDGELWCYKHEVNC